jgi:hypothetical protein
LTLLIRRWIRTRLERERTVKIVLESNRKRNDFFLIFCKSVGGARDRLVGKGSKLKTEPRIYRSETKDSNLTKLTRNIKPQGQLISSESGPVEQDQKGSDGWNGVKPLKQRVRLGAGYVPSKLQKILSTWA